MQGSESKRLLGQNDVEISNGKTAPPCLRADRKNRRKGDGWKAQNA